MSAAPAACVTEAASPPSPTPTPSVEARVFASVRVVAKTATDGLASLGLTLSPVGLVESVTSPGGSVVRVVDVRDGRELRRVESAGRRGAAGVALTAEGLWEVVSPEVAVLRDPASLVERRRAAIGGAAWGLCGIDGLVVTSDRTNRLVLRDSGTFGEVRAVTVSGHWAEGQRLGALACVREDGRGQVWAVVVGSDWLVRVDLANGHVTGVASLARIRAEEPGAGGAVGGIAASGDPGELWVSGEFRHRFKVRLDGAGR
ncbi:hypothetical protein BN6_19860 [Saccharothrix espanaensis DSM 44229]|uniref:Uncharacterized protein n=1 Tax=Saccharothrix espanaensis (strain ATCC 51144 / DSM 44229 / JCM 9112 / NBRC 15066 / NRRL 15764) TaxID=1179773 RepID=K0JUW2_SACES|nr:hypothetical protein BN6_19860 [Saccharothrix espanaensis DSM 44229]